MAKTEKKTTAPGAAQNRPLSSRILKFLLALLLLLILFGLMMVGYIGLKRALFTRNPHFVLRGVESNSIGYWNGRNRQLEAALGLKLEQDNLFALNLKDLRRRLVSLDNVKDASVERVLPDLLRIQLEERIPRAIVYGHSGNTVSVVDDSTVIMPYIYYTDLAKTLPKISGLDPRVKLISGNDIQEIKPAINLIMTAVQYFPEFQIEQVWVSNPDRLSFTVLYRKRNYKVLFPLDTDFVHSFAQLTEAINKRNSLGGDSMSYDLTNKNQVIIR